MKKRFVNEQKKLIPQTLDGVILAASASSLARLDGYPETKVVIRQNIDPAKVAVISGGGAGHEPAHAGFVGQGMLTGAISGEVFASPSVDAVLDCIQAGTGDAGALLVVKNYTGDRLNFGLAAEKAKAMGLKVEMVIVGDDIALPDSVQPRGIAGTLFVHKVAGYWAEQGASLSEVAAHAQATADAIASLGVAYSSSSGPFQADKESLGADEGELGLGIHGEPGVERIQVMDVKLLVARMAERLLAALPGAGGNINDDTKYAVLINNLGSVPVMEMSVITQEVLCSPLADKIELLFGPAPLMTSLNMNGFSLSLVALDGDRRRALLAPVEPLPWSVGVEVHEVQTVPMPQREVDTEYAASDDAQTRAVLDQLCQVLIKRKDQLDEYDAKVGDADAGTTIAAGASAIQARLNDLPLAEPGPLCQAAAEVLLRSMGGSSGVLLSILLTAMGAAIKEQEKEGGDWGAALMAGIESMQQYGGAEEGDRTMLDALIPAARALADGGTAQDAADAAQSGADSTAAMDKAEAGRSSYLSSGDLAGVPDPGAVAVAVAFRSIASSLHA